MRVTIPSTCHMTPGLVWSACLARRHGSGPHSGRTTSASSLRLVGHAHNFVLLRF
jgi:hypothetical protein